MNKTKKRFIVFGIMIFLMVATPLSKPIFSNIPFDDITYYFYATYVDDRLSAKVINCGDAYIVECGLSDAPKTKSQLGGIQGESVRIKNYSNETYTQLLNKYNNKIIKIEIVDDITIYLCYDDSLSKLVYIDGQKVNTQISISKSEINIGYPLILVGY